MHVPIKRFSGARPLSADEILKLQPMKTHGPLAVLANLESQEPVPSCPAVIPCVEMNGGRHDR